MITVTGQTVMATCDRCGREMVLGSGSVGQQLAASAEYRAEVLGLAEWTCGADEPDVCERCANPDATEPVNYSEAWRRKISDGANDAVSTGYKPV